MTIDLHTRRHKYNDMKKREKNRRKYSKRTNYLDTKAKAKVKNGFGLFLATNHHTFQYKSVHFWSFIERRKRTRRAGEIRTEICHGNGMWYDFAVGRSFVWKWQKVRKCANKTTQNGVKNQKLVHWFHSFIRFFSRLNFHWKIYPVKCQQKWNKKSQ